MSLVAVSNNIGNYSKNSWDWNQILIRIKIQYLPNLKQPPKNEYRRAYVFKRCGGTLFF